jgi:synaptobrevin homolog YKT6
LACVLVTDSEYPSRVAFNCIKTTFDEVESIFEESPKEIKSLKKDFAANGTFLDFLKNHAQLFNDPVKADKILKVKKDLEEVKEVLGQALEKLLDREENLEKLIQKSDDLSETSKEFYINSRSTCCTIL